MTETENRNNFLHLGRIYLSQENFDFALQNFNKCIQIDPEYLKSYILVAFTQYKLKNYDQLYSAYQKCREIESLINQNSLQQQQENVGKKPLFRNTRDVKSLLQKLSGQDKSIGKYFFQKGQDYLKANKINDAQCEFMKCVELTPGDAVAHFYLGHCQALNHQNIEALQSYQICLKIQKYNFECYFMMGILYYRIGEQKQAIRCYRLGQLLQDTKKAQKEKLNLIKHAVLSISMSQVQKKFKNNYGIVDDMISFFKP